MHIFTKITPNTESFGTAHFKNWSTMEIKASGTSMPYELFSNAHQIILFPTPVVNLCTLNLLEEKKRQAHSKS
jgi:hypothetical protein